MKLVEHVLRSFDGTGNQLWVEHHVKGINAEMVFSLLFATVHFDGVTHGLEGMERETDRQYDIPQDGQVGSKQAVQETVDCIVPMDNHTRDPELLHQWQVDRKPAIEIVDEEIVVFEETEETNIGDQA